MYVILLLGARASRPHSHLASFRRTGTSAFPGRDARAPKSLIFSFFHFFIFSFFHSFILSFIPSSFSSSLPSV